VTGHETLSGASFTRKWNQLLHAGDPGVQVLLAYTVKENLRQLLALAGTNPDREVISHRLYTFYDQAAASRAPEVRRLAATIETWWPAIEAGIVTNHRRRIRWACTRQHRRATARITQLPAQV